MRWSNFYPSLSLALARQALCVPLEGKGSLELPRNADPNPEPIPLPGDPKYTYVPISGGYVAFGDSYAAGIGTGTTSSDSCRRGEFAHPKLLHDLAGDGSDFQNLPCSGAKVDEILQGHDKSQIDAWTKPGVANLATLSVGGNDVGFYNILTACVLRIEKAHAGNCDNAIKQAEDTMQGAALRNDISSALHQMIDKSGKTDFKVFQTGYPAFFNEDTDSCDYTTFDYYEPGHHTIPWPWTYVYLTKDLRKKLNKVVMDLNAVLSSIVDDVNKEYPAQRVWFVDVNSAYNGHRFCEEGVTEPDSSREDTWLFLSGWPDNLVPGGPLTTIDEAIVGAKGPSALKMPDAATCASTTEWYTQILCGMQTAGEIQAAADGSPEVTPNSTIKDVPWYIPTRQAKTFHPRSQGHMAYMAKIREVW